MVFNGNVSPTEVNSTLANVNFDVKHGLRANQKEINDILAELSDSTKDLVIDGQRFSGEDKFGTAATLVVNNKMEELQNSTTTIISVFSEMYKLEKSLSGS
jgi:hypothetical protein